MLLGTAPGIVGLAAGGLEGDFGLVCPIGGVFGAGLENTDGRTEELDALGAAGAVLKDAPITFESGADAALGAKAEPEFDSWIFRAPIQVRSSASIGDEEFNGLKSLYTFSLLRDGKLAISCRVLSGSSLHFLTKASK